MIKANELRLGNWVDLLDSKTGHNFVQVTYSLLNAENFIEPIPLTPEILGRCGFEDNGFWHAEGSHSINIGKDDKDAVLSIYLEDQEFYIHYNCYHDSTTPKAKIQYLHQLQNLYFALTGEELDVKEQKSPA